MSSGLPKVTQLMRGRVAVQAQGAAEVCVLGKSCRGVCAWTEATPDLNSNHRKGEKAKQLGPAEKYMRCYTVWPSYILEIG